MQFNEIFLYTDWVFTFPEIGYVPPNTASIQRVELEPQRRELLKNEMKLQHHILSLPISQIDIESKPSVKNQQMRTFADLTTSQTVPDLKFIELSHKVSPAPVRTLAGFLGESAFPGF